MIFIKTIIKNSFHLDTVNEKLVNCLECPTSCQSACKTSCTVSNQKCENFKLKKLNKDNK